VDGMEETVGLNYLDEKFIREREGWRICI